jgi:hypothetical protein
MSEPLARPRFSNQPLPPYSYVPGFTPHPVSDPRGHLHGQAHFSPTPLDPENWQASETYRFACDLFNHGFYWEAHEAWESLWHAAGRRGPAATWLKALIKLAAAAVKLREGNAAGTRRHARRSLELMSELQTQLQTRIQIYAGVALGDAEDIVRELVTESAADDVANPERLLTQWLDLR